MNTINLNKRSKQLALLGSLMLIGLSCRAQIESFDFEWGNRVDAIEYDSSLFKTDTVSIGHPDLSYIEIIAKVQDGEIVDRCSDEYKYVFPLRVECNDTCYLISFTASGLYSTGYNKTMSMYDFQQWLVSSLQRRDTVRLQKIPIGFVGSANYLIGESYDVEFVHFRKSKWAFLSYYFSLDESGLWYNFLGNDFQIPLVVNQLYSWGILVIDGAGTDQRSTIAILKKDYPDYFDKSDIVQGNKMLSEWTNVFGNKRLFRKKLIPYSIWAD